MNKYQNGKIYKISVGTHFYFGSTTLPLSIRYNLHKSHCGTTNTPLYEKMRNQESSITLIELFPCNSSEELRQREDLYIRIGMANPTCLNKRVGFQSRQERLTYLKSYNSRKVKCECGTEICRGNMARHKSSKAHST